MREIKFRGLRTDANEFVYGYYVKTTAAKLGIDDVILPEARICHVIIMDDIFFHIKVETIGQYTGLKDCNGVEIYEGDIISVHEDGENIFNHEVKYNNCGYWIDVNGVDFDYTSLTYATEQFCYEYEVIGNVHQNPELLE